MTDMTIAPATLGPLGPFDQGRIEGELDFISGLDIDQATDRTVLANAHDPLYGLGYSEGYGDLHGIEFEYVHHHAQAEIAAFLATAHWGETPHTATPRRVPTRREVRQARKAHRTHR